MKTKRFKLIGEMEGRMARWYARNRATGSQPAQVRRQAAALAAGLKDGAKVLEVAFGPGQLSIELARTGRFEVTGVDISHTFVEIATAQAKAEGVRATFCQGDVARLPFGDGTFDLVVCQAAFKNFTEPVKALDQMHRVLKPGGRAVIDDLSREATGAEIDEEVKRMELHGFDALATRFILSTVLRHRAYSRQGLEQVAAGSAFGSCVFERDGIGFRAQLSR